MGHQKTQDVAAFFAATPGVSYRIINELRNTRDCITHNPGVSHTFSQAEGALAHYAEIVLKAR